VAVIACRRPDTSEDTANVVGSAGRGASLYIVSFTGPSGVRHSVDVTADSLYEAAGLALARLQKEGAADQGAPAAKLEVQVREPATTHTVVRWRRSAVGAMV
jgi:hypothetical protein